MRETEGKALSIESRQLPPLPIFLPVNWNSITTNGTAQTRTHGPTHELLTAGGSNVTTDVKGNMTVIPASLRESTATTP